MISKPRSPFNILFVDDEEKIRKMFKKLVEPYYGVLLAEDVPSAIEILETEADNIGVILTDQRMPGQLGADLLRQTKTDYPALVRMLTTAYSDLEDAIDAVNTGEIYRYIHKPWNIDELMIDLRLAMNLFELQGDRQLLIDQKLSVSAKQARLKFVQEAICIASNQCDTGLSVRAVCSGLKKLGIGIEASSQTVHASVVETYWDAEVAHTKNLISVNRLVGALCGNFDSNSLMQSTTLGDVSFEVKGADSSKRIHSMLSNADLQKLIETATQLIASDKTTVVGSYNDVGSRQIVSLEANQPRSDLLQTIANGLLNSADQATLIANLFGVLILAERAGSQVDFSFEAGNLKSISLSFAKEAVDVTDGQDQIEIWLEDLFVLYSSF
jgi:CheY-like chemotaxis protein